ncbi:hypothetical protein Nwat_0827 [Nitrosococcus watsonii C-113]|uniref:Uncharacterized protein n=1 Tax=Nitrosococcus watsoni (strain C-113) TaxID=105559 RepID=D8K482_NITWC|nr:hypothetical protein Nwat_0827 [Nitrosococcus watsonii C-113]
MQPDPTGGAINIMARRDPASPFLDIRVGAQYLADKYPENLKEKPITTVSLPPFKCSLIGLI